MYDRVASVLSRAGVIIGALLNDNHRHIVTCVIICSRLRGQSSLRNDTFLCSPRGQPVDAVMPYVIGESEISNPETTSGFSYPRACFYLLMRVIFQGHLRQIIQSDHALWSESTHEHGQLFRTHLWSPWCGYACEYSWS